MKLPLRILLTALVMVPAGVFAGEIGLENFIVKENLLKNNKIAIIAATQKDVPVDTVNGTFIFSVNGFRQELTFKDGVAVVPQQLERSTFLYVKHVNDSGTHSRLYYVVKKDDNLDPYHINWAFLIIVPLVLVILSILFKRFIIIAAILLIILFLFNHNQGLGLGTFFETVIDGMKRLVA
ncbi:hypothetical protein [Hufsiella ginkgonis]|uniref:Uncharacterized protein n=1 Tax=Hufsiella ginkgonis TaxID=2695274 RepID=A0A7K1XY69_9SPHI|nr:hypothetical protein [Hufsiella ginkgonis]MXV15689.1 hypothetical protein [Hufsiella ginkgonis]